MNCLNRILLILAVISVLLVLVPRVAAEDELGILSVANEVAVVIPPGAAEEQFANSTAVVSYGGCGQGGGCFLTKGRGLQEMDASMDNCNACIKCGNLWGTVDFFGQTIRRCISKIAEFWWKSELGGTVYRSCESFTPLQRKIYTPVAAHPVPTTCDTCVMTDSFWCVDDTTRSTGCYPKKLARNVYCIDAKRNGAVKRLTSCNLVTKTAKAVHRFGTWMPVEIKTCEECVKRKFQWCKTELALTTTRFCTEWHCPGETGEASKTCEGDNKGSKKKLINFAETCAECLTEELKKTFFWCSKTFNGRKINYCVPKNADGQLCPEGNHVTDCSTITNQDNVATVPVHIGYDSGLEEATNLDGATVESLALGVVVASVAAYLIGQ